MGQFYFGDNVDKWVNFKLALTVLVLSVYAGVVCVASVFSLVMCLLGKFSLREAISYTLFSKFPKAWMNPYSNL